MTAWDRISTLMEARGITPAELSRQLGITQSNITAWKMGRAQPGRVILGRLAEHFNVSVDYISGITDDPVYGKNLDTLNDDELLIKYFYSKTGREPTQEESRRLNDLIEMVIKGFQNQ